MALLDRHHQPRKPGAPDLPLAGLFVEAGMKLLGWRWRYILVAELGEQPPPGAAPFDLNDVNNWVEGQDHIPLFVFEFLQTRLLNCQRAEAAGLLAVERVVCSVERELEEFGEILDFQQHYPNSAAAAPSLPNH